MVELVIIGNGFELYHELETSYGHFATYAKKHSPDVYKLLSGLFLASYDYMGFVRPINFNEDRFIDDRWCDFESCLGILDEEDFVQRSQEDVSEYMQELGMEEALVGEFVENISSILDVFRNWVAQVDFPIGKQRSFDFNSTSIFTNFNYTETLETFYDVDQSRIFYIHGRRFTNDPLIVGHDSDQPKPRHKDDLPDYYHNPFYSYLRQTRKPVNTIVPELENWLTNFQNVNKVSVRGHSLARVDFPYFERIAAAYPKAAWSFSYHTSDDLCKIKSALDSLCIPIARVASVATLKEFEVKPDTNKNALTDQLEFQNLFLGEDIV